jgi:hypothetical protein
MARTKQTARTYSSIAASPRILRRLGVAQSAVATNASQRDRARSHLAASHLTNASQASPRVARRPASSSHPRLPASPHRLPVVSRSLTATSLVPSLSVRSVATRSRPSSSSASCPSSVLCVRSLRTSSRISASSPPPLALSRSPSRPTSSRSSRTPTCAPSTPSVSPSVRLHLSHYCRLPLTASQSPRTSSSLVVSVVSAVKLLTS